MPAPSTQGHADLGVDSFQIYRIGLKYVMYEQIKLIKTSPTTRSWELLSLQSGQV